jgi:AraC family transcriptional regulator, ethanolamine operon transcriptional activator
MSRRVYRDFDAFAESIAGVSGRFVPTARSETDWWLDGTHVRSVSLQHLQIGSAATFAGEGQAGSLTLGIPMTDARLMRIDGHALQSNSLIFLTEQLPFTFAAHQSCQWAGVGVPVDSPFIGERTIEMLMSAEGPRAQSDAACLDGLRRVVALACEKMSEASVEDAAALNALEEEVMSLVARTIDASSRHDPRHIGRPQFSRDRVIAKAIALIEANEGQPLFIQDLCRATEVSERTLRNIFQEYFGVGPMRLLKVRQLHEIRSALLQADPAHDTITRVAARYGVWDFSLFARNYKALFAEAPSETLRRPASRDDLHANMSWMRYVSRIFVHGDASGEREGTEYAPPGIGRADLLK